MEIPVFDRNYPLNFYLTQMKPAKPPKTTSGIKRLNLAFESSDYIGEEKFDGCHYFTIGGRLFSPRVSAVDGIPVEKTSQLAHIYNGLSQLGSLLILDGEVYYPGWKSQDVITITGSLPQEALRKQEQAGRFLRYMAYDVIRDHKGNWLYDKPWFMRRVYLDELFTTNEKLFAAYNIDMTGIVTGNNKRTFLDSLLSSGREGIVLKHINMPYVLGKRPAWNWIKCKVEHEDDVIVMGTEPPERIYKGTNFETWPYWENGDPVTKHYAKGWIGSLIFGKYNEKNELVRLGTCTGIDESLRASISQNPQEYIGKVIKVKLMEFTNDGNYRHCNFLQFHTDKNPWECKLKVS